MAVLRLAWGRYPMLALTFFTGLKALAAYSLSSQLWWMGHCLDSFLAVGHRERQQLLASAHWALPHLANTRLPLLLVGSCARTVQLSMTIPIS